MRYFSPCSATLGSLGLFSPERVILGKLSSPTGSDSEAFPKEYSTVEFVLKRPVLPLLGPERNVCCKNRNVIKRHKSPVSIREIKVSEADFYKLRSLLLL